MFFTKENDLVIQPLHNQLQARNAKSNQQLMMFLIIHYIWISQNKLDLPWL